MDNSTLWNWGMKLVGAGLIVWTMLSIAHGLSLGMTHMLSATFHHMLPTP